MGGGAWRAIVRGVAKGSDTTWQLNNNNKFLARGTGMLVSTPTNFTDKINDFNCHKFNKVVKLSNINSLNCVT